MHKLVRIRAVDGNKTLILCHCSLTYIPIRSLSFMYRQADLSLQAGIAQNNSNVWGINSAALETSINQADTLAFSFCLYISVFWPDWSQDLYFTTRLYIKKGLGDFFLFFWFHLFQKIRILFPFQYRIYSFIPFWKPRNDTPPPPIEWNCSICHYCQLVIVDIKAKVIRPLGVLS